MSIPEITGDLASGGQYRATSFLLEITDGAGNITASFDTAGIAAVSRTGNTVAIRRFQDSDVTVTAATVEDAGRLEAKLRESVPMSTLPAPVGSTGWGAGRILRWGCLVTFVLIALIGVIGLLAVAFGGDDESAEPDTLSSNDQRTATAADTRDATEVVTVEQSEPTDEPEQTPSLSTTPVNASGTEVPTRESTATPEPVATDTAIPAQATEPPTTAGEPGTGRSNPIALGETGSTADWEVQILEVIRGEPAYQQLVTVNQFNDPPPPGYEYVLVNARVKYLGSETEAQDVSEFWFRTTGEARVRHDIPAVVDPEPVFEATLFSGAEATGWSTFLARENEANLMAIFEPFLSMDDGDEIYLALDAGAAIAPPEGRLAEKNDLGFDRANPVAVGERIVGDTWEIWTIESVRGDEALARIKEQNQFNEDPLPGMEYVLVHVGARNISDGADAEYIEEYSFELTGDAGRVYDPPVIVDPEPDLSFYVYAGGEVDGWITMQCAAGEQNLKLVYEPFLSFTAEPRYLAIE